VFQLAGGKGNFDKHWPLQGVEVQSERFEIPDKEWWKKMKESQVPIDKKIQHERFKNRN
jgi:hypothetical protein